ncbi:MAG: ACT domain-containing protein [Candidatus Dormiibacterota bacterium]
MRFITAGVALAVCRLDLGAPIPPWATSGRWWTVTRADSELSIVCEQSRVPEGIAKSGPWRALMVEGPLEHELVGVLAEITTTLAVAQVPIFAISTYDTDWVLVPEDRLQTAGSALRSAGHLVEP